MKRIAIFASGQGTNAENIIHYFKKGRLAEVVLVLSDRKEALVLQKAKALGITALAFTKKELYESDYILQLLDQNKVDLIVLAGFLKLIPTALIQHFPHKIINIHPALLPDYGGQGMYGMRVHEAVSSGKEAETGITIHFVNEHFDAGEIIFQKKVALTPGDSPATIAQKVHRLEMEWYPKVIESLLQK